MNLKEHAQEIHNELGHFLAVIETNLKAIEEKLGKNHPATQANSQALAHATSAFNAMVAVAAHTPEEKAAETEVVKEPEQAEAQDENQEAAAQEAQPEQPESAE